MRLPAGIVLFFLSSLLFAQISEIPAAQLLVEQGLDRIEEREYDKALQFFLQAKDLDRENNMIESYITSLSRMVSLEDYESSPEEIDRFLEDKESERVEKEDEAADDDGEVDFITQEQNKEKARQDRSNGEIALFYPVFNSSNGDSEIDSDLRQSGEAFQGAGYNLAFYPDLFNRTIGLEGGYGSFSMEIADDVYLYDEARIGLILRNFFNEQPGVYSLIGTHLTAGLLFGENLDTDDRQMLSIFRTEVFFRDPVLYRLARTPVTKSIALDGKFRFSLLNSSSGEDVTTYMLGYGGGLTVSVGNRLDLSGEFIYRSYTDTESGNIYPSWTVFLGAEYLFR